MVLVLAPRAGIAGLIATLAKWGARIIDVVEGSPSVGPIGNVNVSNGVGGWTASELTETVPGTTMQSAYQLFEFVPQNAGGLVSGGSNNNLGSVSWTVQTAWTVNVAAIRTLRANGTTSASVAASRLLTWDGSQNLYRDPNDINNNVLGVSVNTVLSTGQTARELTVLCLVAGLTITLPPPVLPRRVSVKDRNGQATAGPLMSVNVSGGSTIDGAASVVFTADYQCLNFQCDGANWFQV